MKSLGTWLLAGALLLLGNSAHAGLQLRLKTDGLSPAQQQASQALIDEAMQKLPPSFIERLDRRIDVGWTDDMPSNAYGQATLVAELDLNRKLLTSLTDGSAAKEKPIAPTALCVRNCSPRCCMKSPTFMIARACGRVPSAR